MNNNYSFSDILTEIKKSLCLALPLIASEMVYAISGFIATMMIARLGESQLAANALGWSIFITVILFFIGVLSAISILVSQSFGATDTSGVSKSFKQGFILAILFSIPMMLIMWFSSEVLNIAGQKPLVIFYAKPLFHSLVWAMLPLNLLFIMEQFLIGIMRTKLVMLASIIQIPIQVFFYYGFLFGKLGLPKLGLTGIGYSLTFSYWAIAIFFASYLHYSKQLKPYQLFHKWWQINKTFLYELLRVGSPLGIIYCVEVALFAAVAFMMGAVGTTTLAAYQISYQYLMMALTIIFALSQTATVRAGYEVGKNNKHKLKLAAFTNIGISLAFISLYWIIYRGFPQAIIALDLNVNVTQNQPLIHKVTEFLAIICVLLIGDSIRLVSLGALRGIKDTRFPLLASIIGFWCIAFPCAYITAFKFNFGGEGIWWSVVLGLFTTGMILLVRFNRLLKRIDLSTIITK